MSVGTTALVVGASILGGSAIASGVIGSKSAHSAADKQSEAAKDVEHLATDSAATAADTVDAATIKANEKYAALPDEVKQLLAPYLDLGTSGAKGLKDLLGPGGDLDKQFAFTPGDLTKTPGYQFTLSQGMEAIKRAASAQGKSLGGGTLKSLAKYGEGVASTTYGDEFKRALDTFTTNRDTSKLKLGALLDTTNIGQRSAGELVDTTQASELGQAGNLLSAARYRGDTGLRAADIASGARSSSAAAQAAGDVGAANAWTSSLGSIGNDALTFLSLKSLARRPVATPQSTSSYDQWLRNAGA